MSLVLAVGVVGATVVLAVATEKIIKLLEHFCHLTGLKQFTITAIVIALATSLPELLVSTISAVGETSEIAFGNAVGSNIVNLALVIGITAIWSRVIMFEHDIEEKRIIWPIVASFLPFVMLINGRIGRGDGVILLAVYGIYVWSLLKNGKKAEGEKISFGDKRLWVIVVKLLAWIGVLLVSAWLAVDWAKILAEAIGLPLIFVGLFLVAVGTSLPELVFNLTAVKHHQKSIAIGNVIGSNITNATLIVGLAAIISPIELGAGLVWTTGLEYLFIVLLFLLFALTKKRLDQWEGVVLVLLFVYYTIVELMIR